MRMRAISALALACLPIGCSLLAPQPDRSEVFVLTAVTERTERAGGALTVGIGPVVLPSYLDRAEIVRRSEENRLVFSDDRIWGEPLERGLRRVLAMDLRQILGSADILEYPWPTGTRVGYQIPIEILRFEADERGTVSLDARWKIRSREKGALVSKESSFTETPRDASTASVVAAMSEAVGRLSEEIAAAIRRVAPPGRRAR
jgi:uncharacterized protein